MTRPPAWLLGRLAAVGLTILVVGGTAWFLVRPVVAHQIELREKVESQRLLLGRLIRAESELAVAATAKAQPVAKSAELHLQGASEAIALANLQSSVTAVAARHGIRPRSTRVLQAIERDGVRLAGIQIEIAATTPVLQRIVYALETARPLLFVEQLTAEPIPSLLQGETGEPGQLRTVMHIYGALPVRKE